MLSLDLVNGDPAAVAVDDIPGLLGHFERWRITLEARYTNHAREYAVDLTVPEVSRRLTLPKARVYALIRSGELKSVRHGRSVRVPAAALAAYRLTLSS